MINLRNHKNNGFTLLELLLVLTIMAGAGFVLLIKLPVHVQSVNLAQTSTQLLEELRDMRQAALAENTWYQIRFFPDAKSYRIQRQGTILKEIKLTKGINFLTRPPDLIFNSSGTPSIGTTILLGNESGQQKKIIVAPVGGRIREE